MTRFATSRRLVLLAVFALLLSPLAAMAAQAPTGNYVATTGQSAVHGSAGGGGMHAGGSATGDTSGGKVTMNVSSYSSSDEINALKGLDGKAFLDQLSKYNHGSVSIGGRSFPVNFAASSQLGANYQIYLVSATPYMTSQTGPGGRSASGAGGGFISLEVPTSGSAGRGQMFSTVQVVISTNGSVSARAGGSSATQLTAVAKQ